MSRAALWLAATPPLRCIFVSVANKVCESMSGLSSNKRPGGVACVGAVCGGFRVSAFRGQAGFLTDMRAGDRHLKACFPYLLSEASFGSRGLAPSDRPSAG